MRRTLIAVAFVLSTADLALAQPAIAGDWEGALNVGGAELHLVLHLARGDDGVYKGTLDSPDQGAHGIPIASITLTETKVTLLVRAVGGTYEGTVSAEGTTIDGTWSQGAPLPLVFKRSGGPTNAAAAAPRRPQNPVKPYSYREEDVAYENAAANITLAATLTIPTGPGPFPAVLLITGSGPQDRDESIVGHRPFLVLADYLTRRGIAVLRADDRGVGKSGGKFAAATTADFATDAEAGVAFLRTRREIDAKKIGLIGHSEGGVIAPLIAARNPAVAFIVMMAGTGVDGGDVLVAQNVLVVEAMGASHDQAEARGAQIRALTDIVKQEPDGVAREKKMRDLLAGKAPPAQIDAQVQQLNSPWFRYFLAYDPAPALKRLTVPVLAINGERDLQVPPRQNLPAIRKALESSGSEHFEVVELPGLNHLFQTAKTGSPAEYAQIEETMSPVALELIANWILKQ